MEENPLISHLRKGDFSRCSPFLEKALLGGENLVNFLNDLLYIAASIESKDNEKIHPLVTMNCIKNIIGDNRTNPSEPLLSYGLHLSKERKIINYNNAIQKKEIEDDSISSVFVGELEDALQACDWNSVDETDEAAFETFKLLCKTEGILPAFEPSFSTSYAIKLAKKMSKDDIIVTSVCGRGDKDLDTAVKMLGDSLG